MDYYPSEQKLSQLFEENFYILFCEYLYDVKAIDIIKEYKKQREYFINEMYSKYTFYENYIDYYNNCSLKQNCYVTKQINDIFETGKLEDFNNLLCFDSYKRNIYLFENRELLFYHLNFSLDEKAQKSENKKHIYKIVKCCLDKKCKLISENNDIKYTSKSTNYFFKKYKTNEIRHLVIRYIFKSINTFLSMEDNNLNTELKIRYSTKKELSEKFDENKQVEKLLRQKKSKRNDGRFSNQAIYLAYSSIIKDIYKIRNIDDFLTYDKDTRQMLMQNNQIDDVRVLDYFESINKKDFYNGVKTIALNILNRDAYYFECSRQKLIKSCSRGKKELKEEKKRIRRENKKHLPSCKFAKFDYKIIRFIGTIYFNRNKIRDEKESLINFLKML